MKMSTKGRYGLRAMVDLALHYKDGPVLLKDIARRQEVSMKYLDHIIKPLREEGFIDREKDGYILSKPPEKISVLQVVKKVEGSLSPVKCVDNPNFCSRKNVCVTIDIWKSVNKSIEKTLGSKTLDDLIQRQKEKWARRDE